MNERADFRNEQSAAHVRRGAAHDVRAPGAAIRIADHAADVGELTGYVVAPVEARALARAAVTGAGDGRLTEDPGTSTAAVVGVGVEAVERAASAARAHSPLALDRVLVRLHGSARSVSASGERLHHQLVEFQLQLLHCRRSFVRWRRSISRLRVRLSDSPRGPDTSNIILHRKLRQGKKLTPCRYSGSGMLSGVTIRSV